MASVAAAQNKPVIDMAEPNVDQGTLLIYGQGFTANNRPTVVTLSGAPLRARDAIRRQGIDCRVG